MRFYYLYNQHGRQKQHDSKGSAINRTGKIGRTGTISMFGRLV